MKIFKFFVQTIGLSLLVLASLSAFAQDQNSESDTLDELVVSASRIPVPPKQVGSSVSVIRSEDIKVRKPRTVDELLREVPGVAVNAATGSFTQIRMRGAEGNHTLVELDGIKLNDPYWGNEFHFEHLPVQMIDRIEVLRGPQSSIYGSDAIGGVIALSTPEYDENSRPSIEAGYGSQSTYSANAMFGSASPATNVTVMVSTDKTDGVSAAKAGTEPDGTEKTAALLKAVGQFTDNVELSATAMYIDSQIEFDSPPVDDDNSADIRKTFLVAKAVISQMEGTLKHTIQWSGTDQKWVDIDNGERGQNSIGKVNEIEYQVEYLFGSDGADQSIVFAVGSETNKYSRTNAAYGDLPNEKIKTTNYTLEHRATIADSVFTSLSARYDDNSNNRNAFQNHTTWRATGAYLFGNDITRAHASYGTGIKNPAITELYGFDGSFVGNPDLKPETSKGWDLGLEHSFGNMTVDATYFDNRITNEILGFGNYVNPDCTDFGCPQWAVNSPGVNTTKGWEVSARGALGADWELSANLTLSKARTPSGEQLVRRPDRVASVNLNRSFTYLGKSGNLNLNIQHNGKQSDVTFPAPNFTRTLQTLKGYTLVHLSGNLQISENTNLFAKVENLLDTTDYEEIVGYGESGRTLFAGINYTF